MTFIHDIIESKINPQKYDWVSERLIIVIYLRSSYCKYFAAAIFAVSVKQRYICKNAISERIKSRRVTSSQLRNLVVLIKHLRRGMQKRSQDPKNACKRK